MEVKIPPSKNGIFLFKTIILQYFSEMEKNRNLFPFFSVAAADRFPGTSHPKSQRSVMIYEKDSFHLTFYLIESGDGDNNVVDTPECPEPSAVNTTGIHSSSTTSVIISPADAVTVYPNRTVPVTPDSLGTAASSNTILASSENNNGPFITPSSSSPPSQCLQKKRHVTPRENVRRRTRNPEKWEKKNRKKEAINTGKEFVCSSGNHVKARKMRPACPEECLRCDLPKLTEEERLVLFTQFWELRSVEQKWDFISRCVSCIEPSTRSTVPERAKSATRIYRFKVGDRVARVCKTMFLATLGVSHGRVDMAIKKVENRNCISPDERGTHNNRTNRVPLSRMEGVKRHIDSIPRVQSHYDRNKTKREYVENGLSLKEMYRLYVQHCEDTETSPSSIASERQYREIFVTHYNIGSELPKKDLCLLCSKWKNGTDEKRRRLEHEYDEHIRLFRRVTHLKRDDKKDPETCVSCFDLQKVLTLPRSQISVMFYEQKLSLYNLTVFQTAKNIGYCYLWDETVASRGANEISSNLLQYSSMKNREGYKKLSYYSDACAGQNRNRMVFTCHLYAAIRYEMEVSHRFLETGHSFSEADSVHGRIETQCTRKEIFSLEEYYDHIVKAKKEGEEYRVIPVGREMVFDFKDLTSKLFWKYDEKKKKVL